MANNYPQKVAKLVMDSVFPIRCIGCGSYDIYFCNSCLAKVKIKNDSELVGAVHVFSATNYSDKLVQEALKVFKYNFVKDIAYPLGEIIKIYIDTSPVISPGLLNDNPLLVPVPSHKNRLNWRGFNQSEILAEHIASNFSLEISRDILVRTRNVQPQADIEDREQRLNNIEGSFICTQNLEGRNIILVDDICTTGATLKECTKALVAKGAGKVRALVIARG